MTDIVAVVPIKRQSERVANKNIRPFGGTTLFELKLQQLKEAKCFREVIIASEDDSILQIAIDHGLSVFKRDPYYSTSDVSMSEVYSYIASNVVGEYIAWINVTNPLAESFIYTNALCEFETIKEENFDCFLSVWEVKENIFYEGLPVNFTPSPWPRSQDLSGCYAMSFIINILKRQDMVSWGSCVGRKPYFFVVDPITSTDIDFEEDFQLCEMIYLDRKKHVENR
jgi:CMP-N-acetylneuraminic acid synthetase